MLSFSPGTCLNFMSMYAQGYRLQETEDIHMAVERATPIEPSTLTDHPQDTYSLWPDNTDGLTDLQPQSDSSPQRTVGANRWRSGVSDSAPSKA